MNKMFIYRKCAMLIAAISSCLLLGTAAAETTSATKPNILWITIEDFSPHFSFYGDATAHTPNLAKLAEQGCVFTRAFATSPICAPSRSTLITGVYAATLGTHNMRTSVPLPPDIKPFPAFLRKAGYYCTNNVKTDYNFPIPDGTWDESSRKAHWRNRPDPSQPFFSVFNITTTHEGKYKFNNKKFDELVQDVKPEHRVDPAKVSLPPYYPDTSVTRKDWARHYDMASQMDIEAGRILDQLKEDNLLSNTVVFFFSDHGVGMPRNKRWMYDGGLQVPLIIKWPGAVKPGTRNEELVSLIDIAPTLLSLLQLDVPEFMQGRIFLGDAKQPEPEYIFATRDRVDETEEVVRAVRDRRFKYIKNFTADRPYTQSSAYADENPTLREMRRMHKDGTLTGPATVLFHPGKPVEELYDTEGDPFEIQNLADQPEHSARLVKMRKALGNWQALIGDKGMQPEPEDEKLRAAEARTKRQE